MSTTLITAKSAAIQAASAITLALTSAVTVQAGGDDVDPASVALDIVAASNMALATVPGTVVEAELEDEDGVVVWEMEVVAPDGKAYEIVIDANTGDVLEHGLED